MLLEDYRGCERCLQTMRCPSTHDTAESPHRVAVIFIVVGEGIEPALYSGRRTQLGNQPALGSRERKVWSSWNLRSRGSRGCEFRIWVMVCAAATLLSRSARHDWERRFCR